MDDFEKTILGLECCCVGAEKEPTWNNLTARNCWKCPYNKPGIACTRALTHDALYLLKAQEPRVKDQKEATALQGFLLDIPSSVSILNSVNCHAISLEDASRIIAICACACDAMSPSAFICWLKERFKQDLVLRGYVE